MQRTIRRRDLKVSSMSHLAVVDGERVTDGEYLKGVVEGEYTTSGANAGLFDPALVAREIQPDQIRLCEQCTAKSVIWEDPSLGSAELRQLIQLRKAFVKKFNERWATYRSLEMRRLRKECTSTKVRYGFREEARTRTVKWSYTIRVLREDLLKLPYAVWPGMPPSDVPHALDSYKPSNAAKLALGSHKDVVAIRVERSKVIHYVAHVRYIKGTKTWLDRQRLRTMIAAWMGSNPRPPASHELEYLNLTEQINRLRRKMAGEWKRCANICTAGYVDARPLIAATRAAHAPYVALTQNAYPWGNFWDAQSLSHLERWPGAMAVLREAPGILVKGVERETFAQVNFSPKVINTTSHGFSESHKGNGGEILQGVNYPVIQDELGTNRYDRARLALENGQLDGDDLDKADFNAFRSVAELKDLGQTWKQAKDFIQWLKATRHGKLLRAATTLKGAASAYLAQLFAVQPTIDDVNTLLKHTRAELLGIRRGLWKLASALNLFSARAVTLRKYAARKFNVPRRPRRGGTPDYGPYLLTDIFRDEFPESWSVIRSTPTRSEWVDHLEPLDGGMVKLCLDVALPNVSSRDMEGNYTSRLVEPEDFNGVLTRVEPSLLPHWYLGDERAVLFASFKPEEILEALDPSRVENLAETMKLAKNAWELYPLSFVVDWLMTTGDVAKDIQNLLGSTSSGLFSDSGVWCSLPRNLYAVVPRYRVTQTISCFDFDFAALGPRPEWDSSLQWWVARGPRSCSISTQFMLDAVEVIRTDVRQFARGPMVSAVADPLRAIRLLAPRFRVNLGTGQLSTLLAMLISST